VVPNSQVLTFFAPDLGHSIFHVPLAKRQAELEDIDWVRTATVMRLWPNRLRINLVERTPVAFARDGNTVRLVDDDGILLDLPNAVAQHYSFPVISGISSSDPVSTRAARMQMYRQFLHALDADGGHVTATLSEVDLSDPEDIRAIFAGGPRNPTVHFGDTDFLARYGEYQSHLTEWLQQYPQLRSVDMRYGKQVVLDMGTASTSAPQAATPQTVAPKTGITGTVPHANTPSHILATKTKTKARPRSRLAKHSSKTRKPVYERGHTVRDPIAHVVSGL
jgi:cell division protein FtsQ